MSNLISSTHYIYLLQEREFVQREINIYKVGRTKKANYHRFNQYPNGSVLMFQMICNDCIKTEKHILTRFKNTFNQRQDCGYEYFEGDYHIMIDIIYEAIKNESLYENKASTLNAEEEIEYDNAMSNNDPYRDNLYDFKEFVKDKICKKMGNKIQKPEVFETFKLWWWTNYSRTVPVPKGYVLYEFMNKQFGKCVNHIWHNVSIIYDDDIGDVVDEETIINNSKETHFLC